MFPVSATLGRQTDNSHNLFPLLQHKVYQPSAPARLTTSVKSSEISRRYRSSAEASLPPSKQFQSHYYRLFWCHYRNTLETTSIGGSLWKIATSLGESRQTWPGDTVPEAWTNACVATVPITEMISVLHRRARAPVIRRADEPRQRSLSSVKRVRAVGLDMRTRPKRAKRDGERALHARVRVQGHARRGVSGCVADTKTRGPEVAG